MKKIILSLILTFVVTLASAASQTTLDINVSIDGVIFGDIDPPIEGQKIAFNGDNFSLEQVPQIKYHCTGGCDVSIDEDEFTGRQSVIITGKL